MALRAVRGVEKSGVEILRALAFDNQTSNFTVADTVTGIGAFATGVLTAAANATGAVRALGTLTGTTIAADDTVTVESIVYTYVAAISTGPTIPGEVLVGTADTDSLDNLIAAMNGGAGVGVLYSVGTTAQSDVTARPAAGDTMIVEANVPGTAGNALTTVASLSAGDFGAATLASGEAGDTVTIDTDVYIFCDAPLYDQPNYVLVAGSASDSLDNLIAAVNGAAGEGTLYGTGTTQPAVTAAAGSGDTIDLTADVVGTAEVTTETGAQLSFANATLSGGIAASGANGTLTEQTDSGATGTLILRDVVGEFTDNERISDGASADGLANGVLAVPALTPADSLIMQVDAVDMPRGEAIEMIDYIKQTIRSMGWHNGSGFIALRISRGQNASDVQELGALAFDGQGTNLTVGHLITGSLSSATGYLIEQTDAGASGTIIMDDINGLFENNDALTDEGTGDGDSTGTQTCPLLTPSDQIILQMDAVDMTKSDALELLRLIESTVFDMDWPAAA
jgi:hypothetical protein